MIDRFPECSLTYFFYPMEWIVNFYELQNSGNKPRMCQQIDKVYVILAHARSSGLQLFLTTCLRLRKDNPTAGSALVVVTLMNTPAGRMRKRVERLPTLNCRLAQACHSPKSTCCHRPNTSIKAIIQPEGRLQNGEHADSDQRANRTRTDLGGGV